MYKLNLAEHPYCLASAIKQGLVEGPLWPSGKISDLDLVRGGEIENFLHFLTECIGTWYLWGCTRRKILDLLPGNCHKLSNKELIWLIFPDGEWMQSILWLISTYVNVIYVEIIKRKIS